jgi:hypothetical protein
MRFAKLPDRALATVQQVVDDDPDFRARVVAWADEAKLVRQAWVWLVRPEGWEQELGIPAGAGGGATPPPASPEDELSVRPRLPGALSAAQTEAELALLRQVSAELTEGVTGEQEARSDTAADRDASEVSRQEAVAHREAADEAPARLEEAVRALEGQVSSPASNGDEVADLLTPAAPARATGSQIALLTAALEEARAEAAQLRSERAGHDAARQQAEAERDAAESVRRQAAEDRDAAESARRQAAEDRESADAARRTADHARRSSEEARRRAEEEQGRLEAAGAALENRVSVLLGELEDMAAQLREARDQRDAANDQVGLLFEELQQAQVKAARLQASRDEIRAAAGREIARAAEAARLLSEALAEAAMTRGSEAEGPMEGLPAGELSAGRARLTGGARLPGRESGAAEIGVAGDEGLVGLGPRRGDAPRRAERSPGGEGRLAGVDDPGNEPRLPGEDRPGPDWMRGAGFRRGAVSPDAGGTRPLRDRPLEKRPARDDEPGSADEPARAAGRTGPPGGSRAARGRPLVGRRVAARW